MEYGSYLFNKNKAMRDMVKKLEDDYNNLEDEVLKGVKFLKWLSLQINGGIDITVEECWGRNQTLVLDSGFKLDELKEKLKELTDLEPYYNEDNGNTTFNIRGQYICVRQERLDNYATIKLSIDYHSHLHD